MKNIMNKARCLYEINIIILNINEMKICCIKIRKIKIDHKKTVIIYKKESKIF